MDRYKHKASGRVYTDLGTVTLQTAVPMVDNALLRLYQGDDAAMWVRPMSEFDSRFELVSPLAVRERLTREQAEAEGYRVDRHCYPWFGYKGARFAPAAHVYVYTDLEATLLGLQEPTKGDFT